MDNASPRKSALKSPLSQKHSFHSVSFEDLSTSDSSSISSSCSTTPISNPIWSLRSSPSLETSLSDQPSSADGHSIAEITCLDVDDIASYSPKYLKKKRYISPNMSRRRINGPDSSFLSDEEDDYDKDFDDEVVLTKSRDTYFKNDSNKLDVNMNSSRHSRPRDRIKIVTSSPSTPHHVHHISSHDHYYDGMLLRSGSHVKGSRRRLRQAFSNTLGDNLNGRSPGLAPTYRSDTENIESHRRNRRTVTTVSTTTTDTSFDEEDDENSYIEEETESLNTENLKKGSQTVSETYQKSEDLEDNERKLHLDESQTEKYKGKSQFRLRHLDGLDYDEDFSDVDDIGSRYHRKQGLAYRQTSILSRISSFFILIVTTVTTTVTESAQNVLSPAATTAFTTVTSPIRWLGRAIISTYSWILWHSSSVLLLDIEAKQRRKRGCCCCLLPLLLLLPLAVLAGYYSAPMKEKVGGYLSASETMISSYWSSLWISPSPVFVPPPPKQSESETNVNYQVDMTRLDQHIHQTILQVMSQQQTEQPQGLTAEQVEAIAKAFMAAELDTTRKRFDGDLKLVNDAVNQDLSNVKIILAALEKEIHESDRNTKVLAGNLDAAKVSLGSLSEEQRVEWRGIAEMLENKLLDMRNELNQVTNQNLALTAMLTSCCRNNSMIKEVVHSHLLTFFSQIDKDNDSAAITGLMSLFGNQFANKDETDEKLSAISDEISKKIEASLAKQAKEIQVVQATANGLSQESIFSRLEKEKDSAAIASLMSLFDNKFITQAELDEKLSAVAVEITDKMRIALAKQAEEIQTIQARANEVSQEPVMSISANVDELVIKTIVEDALLKFSADGIGKPDFALESAGGSVLNVRCSETYYRKTALVSVFGLPLWYTSNSPRTVIQPSVHPGECWAFKGTSGYIVIQLSQPIQPTGFTLEHIPRSLAPSGDIDSAPQSFSVFGLTAEDDVKGINLGNYTYSDSGRPLQHFPIQNQRSGVFQYVELRVNSNYGNVEYTCVYRFRVHGVP